MGLGLPRVGEFGNARSGCVSFKCWITLFTRSSFVASAFPRTKLPKALLCGSLTEPPKGIFTGPPNAGLPKPPRPSREPTSDARVGRGEGRLAWNGKVLWKGWAVGFPLSDPRRSADLGKLIDDGRLFTILVLARLPSCTLGEGDRRSCLSKGFWFEVALSTF